MNRHGKQALAQRSRSAVTLVAAGLVLCATQSVAGPDWSLTEIHLQYGALKNPDFAGGGNLDTFTTTLQHASIWGPADVFFFVDLQNIEGGNTDIYSEAYAGLSLANLSGRKIALGPLEDIGLRFGINVEGDAEIRRYLPGIRLTWDIPGFQFLHTDFLAFLDDSGGIGSGGAPKQSDSWNFNVSWSLPFRLGGSRFLFFGHAEYAGKRIDETGNPVSWWVLAQPQLRFDLGDALKKVPDKLYVGVEWQYWLNKQGERGTDENALQALIVWRF